MKRARSIRLQPKLLLGLVAMAAVLAAILAPTIAQLYRARMEEQYASLAFGQASVAAFSYSLTKPSILLERCHCRRVSGGVIKATSL